MPINPKTIKKGCKIISFYSNIEYDVIKVTRDKNLNATEIIIKNENTKEIKITLENFNLFYTKENENL